MVILNIHVCLPEANAFFPVTDKLISEFRRSELPELARSKASKPLNSSDTWKGQQFRWWTEMKSVHNINIIVRHYNAGIDQFSHLPPAGAYAPNHEKNKPLGW